MKNLLCGKEGKILMHIPENKCNIPENKTCIEENMLHFWHPSFKYFWFVCYVEVRTLKRTYELWLLLVYGANSIYKKLRLFMKILQKIIIAAFEITATFAQIVVIEHKTRWKTCTKPLQQLSKQQYFLFFFFHLCIKIFPFLF